jgi:hypothetical protein
VGRSRRRLEALRHGLERCPVAEKHAQAFLQIGGSTIERLNRLDPRSHFVALHFRR